MSSRGRFAPPADFPLHDCSPYRGLHVRRERLGFVPSVDHFLFVSFDSFLSRSIRNFFIAVGLLMGEKLPGGVASLVQKAKKAAKRKAEATDEIDDEKEDEQAMPTTDDDDGEVRARLLACRQGETQAVVRQTQPIEPLNTDLFSTPCAQEEREAQKKARKATKKEAKRAAKAAKKRDVGREEDSDQHAAITKPQVSRSRCVCERGSSHGRIVSEWKNGCMQGSTLDAAGEGETEAERKERKKEAKRLKKEAKRAAKEAKLAARQQDPSGGGGSENEDELEESIAPEELELEAEEASEDEMVLDLDADTEPTQVLEAEQEEAAEQPRRRRLIKRSREEEGSDPGDVSAAAALSSDDDEGPPAATRVVRKAVLESSDDEA
jgi:hypothetical protein